MVARTLSNHDTAVRILSALRKSSPDSALDAFSILWGLPKLQRLMREVGLTLADIGTDEMELERLRLSAHTTQALANLQRLRDGKLYGANAYDITMLDITFNLAAAGFELGDVGTSKEELEQLRHWTIRRAAVRYLHELRAGIAKGPMSYAYYTSSLRKALNDAGLVLEDIGTSETELMRLRP